LINMSRLFPNLESWIKKQYEIMETFKKAEENFENFDRLELILLARMAFQHVIKTFEAFDQWLREPVVTTHMPRELLIDLWVKLRNILYETIELDVEHTSKFYDHVKKLEMEGKINPIFYIEKPSGKTTRSGMSTAI